MRLENRLNFKQIILTQLCLLIFISIMFSKTFMFSLVVPCVVLLIMFGLISIQFPLTVPILMIGSLFFGFFFIRCYEVGITPAQIMILLALVGCISSYLSNNKPMILSKEQKTISIALGLFVLSLVPSILGNSTVLPNNFVLSGSLMIVKFIEYLLVFLLMILLSPTKSNINLYIYSILIFSLLQFPVVLFQYTNFSNPSDVINRNVLGTMSYHHGMIGTFMLIPLGLSIGQFFITKEKNLKIFLIISAGIFLLQLILSSTRSALIGVFGALTIFALIKFRIKIKYIIFLFFLFLFIIVLYYCTPLREIIDATIKSNTRNGVDISSLLRLVIWKGGFDFYIDSDIKTKLIGIGLGAYSLIPYRMVIDGGLRHAFGAHNNYLNTICETGILGFALFGIFWFLVLKQLYKKSNNPLCIAYFYVTIAMLISGITQETFWVTASFYNLWTIYMIGLALVLNSASITGEKNDV